MNTSEAQLVEKPKHKNKPRVDRYSQNEAFAVMILAFGYTLFFWLDDLLGAVDFEPTENRVAAIGAVLIPGLILLLYHRWHGSIGLRAWVQSLVLIGVCTLTSPFMFIGQLFGSLLTTILPFETLIGIYFGIICLVIAIRIIGLKPLLQSRDIPTYGILIFAVFYGLGASLGSFLSGYKVFGQELARSHNYILIVNYDIDFPDEASLYECNPYSFGCQNIYYQRSSGRFLTKESPYYDPDWANILELVQGEQDNVLVLVDGEVVFDSSEDS